MSTNPGKQLLSYVRVGDFAHPGEIEAIQSAMRPIAKKSSQQLLDVGCGLGGTAHYLQQQGWGHLTGIDIDADNIQYAKTHYPHISFVQGDILASNMTLQFPFQVICCFSSFFCFASQQKALHQFSHVAAPGCELMIFDYSRPSEATVVSPFPWSPTASRFHPIYLPELKEQLEHAGWHFKTSLNITSQFEYWYLKLLHQLDAKKKEILLRFDEELFNSMYKGYTELLEAITAQQIGGTIIYARLK